MSFPPLQLRSISVITIRLLHRRSGRCNSTNRKVSIVPILSNWSHRSQLFFIYDFGSVLKGKRPNCSLIGTFSEWIWEKFSGTRTVAHLVLVQCQKKTKLQNSSIKPCSIQIKSLQCPNGPEGCFEVTESRLHFLWPHNTVTLKWVEWGIHFYITLF